MTYTYRNPWAKQYEPQNYTRNIETKPIKHAGCMIYKVSHDQFDVVKSGVCIAQRAGKSGAMQCAEAVHGIEAPTYEDVHTQMLERHGHY